MNRQLDNKAAAYGLTLDRAKSNPAIFEDMPGMAVDVALFETLFNKLKKDQAEFELVMAGKNKDKAKAETTLLDAIQPVKAKLKWYAGKQDDEALKVIAEATPTAVKEQRDEELVRYAQNLLDTVIGLGEKMKPSGLKQAGIDRLSAALTDFKTKMTIRDESKNDRTGAGEKMYDDAAKIDILLTKSIDPLVQSVQEEQPDFYAAYFATRTVHDHGLRHRKPPEPPAPPTTPDAQS